MPSLSTPGGVGVLRGMSVLSSGYEQPNEIGQDFTSIDLRLADVGRAGAELLHRFATEGSAAAESVKVPPGMFPGQSTFAPARGSSSTSTSTSNPTTHSGGPV